MIGFPGMPARKEGVSVCADWLSGGAWAGRGGGGGAGAGAARDETGQGREGGSGGQDGFSPPALLRLARVGCQRRARSGRGA